MGQGHLTVDTMQLIFLYVCIRPYYPMVSVRQPVTSLVLKQSLRLCNGRRIHRLESLQCSTIGIYNEEFALNHYLRIPFTHQLAA